jgi:hypothetical protein
MATGFARCGHVKLAVFERFGSGVAGVAGCDAARRHGTVRCHPESSIRFISGDSLQGGMPEMQQ